jgi:hypothetical protein
LKGPTRRHGSTRPYRAGPCLTSGPIRNWNVIGRGALTLVSLHSIATYMPHDPHSSGLAGRGLAASRAALAVWGSRRSEGLQPCGYRGWSPAAGPANDYRMARLRRGARVCGGGLLPHEDKRSCLCRTWWFLMRRVVRLANCGTLRAPAPQQTHKDRCTPIRSWLVVSLAPCGLGTASRPYQSSRRMTHTRYGRHIIPCTR